MPPADDVVPAKAALRARLLAARRARPAAERERAATAVAAALRTGLATARTVAAHVPEAVEPGHGRLPGELAGAGTRVLLPVVRGRELAWAEHDGRLAPGRFGLLEPVGPRLGPEAIGSADAVVVPALAVSRSGVRLGRGGGYYDRALAHARPDAVLVAVVFDGELLDDLPAEPHDRRVTAVVTPTGGWEIISRPHLPRRTEPT
ncbi:5-formyltetrahydrofolate cyclo-ligase [Blastococcus sp. TML/M2B]|uniref:5-formyltetrahydrofolate cyclo-ligase n=1 Tax=unclassified Blastococcus TaxID=2619396 RepID=UPI00190BD15B|nr:MULTISPECIES: 5-formyltetrahydrofolate cyclo-ligase [unclassified Blastococcus]MBN1091531.1 5-formyltetrahydrofolate cyclo-ligase [Blastococcus sp. TML/M2B]MBN1094917.1 5-formyltetrahydrofolate cyclo-ligase [Blastococcus sp. TML/C7B]